MKAISFKTKRACRMHGARSVSAAAIVAVLAVVSLPACRPYHIAKSEMERLAAEAEAKLLADLEVERREEAQRAEQAQRVAAQRAAQAQQAAEEQRRVEQQRLAQQREQERQAEQRRAAAERERQAEAARQAAQRQSAPASSPGAQGAATGAGGTCTGEAVKFGEQTMYAVRPQQIDGVTIAGLYRYTDHPSGRPRVELNANGTGVYELWGASAGPGHDRPGTWWILGDCAGNPTPTQTGPGGSAYVLMMRASTTTRFFNAGEVDFYQLIIGKDGRAHVTGERVK